MGPYSDPGFPRLVIKWLKYYSNALKPGFSLCQFYFQMHISVLVVGVRDIVDGSASKVVRHQMNCLVTYLMTWILESEYFSIFHL
jgi:hypothetical protein